MMKREEFLKKSVLTLGSFYLLPSMALANKAPKAETRYQKQEIKTDILYIQGVESYIKCFQARPVTSDKLPCLVLVHDSKGLNKFYIEKAKALAEAGFHVIAPDALSPMGGTMGEMNENRNAIKKLDNNRLIENYTRTIRHLQKLEGIQSGVGIIGFGWGGTLAHELSLRASNLSVAVSYFGAAPKGDLNRLNIPLLLHQAQTDETLNRKKSAFKAALESSGKDYKWIEYKGTQRNFHQKSNKERFDKTARDQAWATSVSFLKEHLTSE